MKKSKKEFELILQLHGGAKKAVKKVGKAVKKAVKAVGGSAVSLLTGGSAEGSAAQATEAAAPTMNAAAAIESATEDTKEDLRNRLRNAKGKNYTNRTGSGLGQDTMQGMRKSLLGE